MDLDAELQKWRELALQALDWIYANVLTFSILGQFVFVILTLVGAVFLARPLKRWLGGRTDWPKFFDRIRRSLLPLITPIVWWVLLFIPETIALALDVPTYLLRVAVNLVGAWIIINILTLPITNRAMSNLVAVVAWTVAALNIVGLLDTTMAVLESVSLPLGKESVSLLGVLVGLLTLIVLIWLAIAVSKLIENRLSKTSTLNPSARVLLSKLINVSLIAIAVLIGLSSTGLDLTLLAAFGGGIGLGLGFGLQKVVSNLFSGFILLMDRSIKPGDVVETQGTYGWINKLAARYTSVITRDGTEYLIPNEDMVTQPVINWSHSNRLVRRSLQVGVAYDADVPLARELTVEAAKETERVLSSPSPRCLLQDFGDSAVILELRFWIEDPQNGVSNVASDVRTRIWEKFHENNVQIPFPQRDLHIVSMPSDGAPDKILPEAKGD